MKHIRFDWAIKRLLRNKANFEVLEGFLSELLKFDVNIDEILESESNQEEKEDKYNRVDILVKNENGELILIEVQNSGEDDFFHRMNYGQAKLLTQYLDIGQKYSEIKKVFSINIVYFGLGQGEDYVYVGKTNFTGLHNKDILELSQKQKKVFQCKDVSDIFTTYYILRINNFDDVAKDSLDEWIYFLKHSEIKDNFKAKGLEKAKKILSIDNLSKEERLDFDKYIKDWRIREAEIETALSEARFLEQKYKKQMEQERTEKEEAKKREEEAKKREEEAKKREEEAKKREEEAKKQEAEARIKVEQERSEKEQALQKLKETARLLKQNGVEIEMIIQTTGLSHEEIEEL